MFHCFSLPLARREVVLVVVEEEPQVLVDVGVAQWAAMEPLEPDRHPMIAQEEWVNVMVLQEVRHQ